MKKSFALCMFALLVFAFATSFALAKFATESEAINTAYQCLTNSTNKTTLSLEESIFTMLALGYHNSSNATIGNQKSPSENCWPSSGCTIEKTAQVGIVYDYMYKNTTGIEKWLYTKNGTATGIEWFLEVDIENQKPATCSILDSAGNTNSFSLSSEQKVYGNLGSCFASAKDGYLLGINPACLDRSFEIKCSETFLTAILYKKTTSETYYVSGETHSAVAEGTTKENIISRCFKSGNSCSYKDTLWAALALQHFGRDVTEFMPYIIALSDEAVNQQFFPNAFIYMLSESDDAYNEIIQSQQIDGNWRLASNNSRIYDTSIGMLALQGSNAQELAKAKKYLLEIQDSNGCWNNKNIRDTAFVLYSGWSQPQSFPGAGNGHTPITIISNGSNSNSKTQCELSGFSCGTTYSCLLAGGIMQNEFSCYGGLECCSVKSLDKQTCSAQNGIVCSSNQRCDGRTGASSSGTCCFGSCVVTSQQNEDSNICESGFYGSCKSTCASDEYDSGFSCSTPGQLCCSSSSQSSEDGGSIWWIVFLLGILVILAIIGIVYKDKLKMWWFKMQNGKTDKPDNRGSGIATPRPNPMIPRRLPQFGGFSPRPMRPNMRAQMRPQQKNETNRNKEYDETLKKLREMSE